MLNLLIWNDSLSFLYNSSWVLVNKKRKELKKEVFNPWQLSLGSSAPSLNKHNLIWRELYNSKSNRQKLRPTALSVLLLLLFSPKISFSFSWLLVQARVPPWSNLGPLILPLSQVKWRLGVEGSSNMSGQWHWTKKSGNSLWRFQFCLSLYLYLFRIMKILQLVLWF